MSERLRGLLWVTLAYLVAFAAAGATCVLLPESAEPLLVFALADVVATVVVFAIGSAFRNASFYDPYWSVVPMALVVWMVLHPDAAAGDPVRHLLLILGIWVWGARLTFNWARGWTGLDHVDWRYEKLRADNPRLYPLINLAGIHLFPTVLVFLGMLSAWAAATSTAPLGALDFVGAAVVIAGAWIQGRADNELRAFKASNPPPGSFIATGLWRYSRHPNYFGEQTVWVGLCIMALGAGGTAHLYTLAGPAAMIALFTWISIPMMEKRMVASRPDYPAYQRSTSACVPLPPRHG